jgi:hypothetical protein
MMQLVTNIAAPIVGTLLIVVAIWTGWVASSVWRGSHNEYERNRARTRKSFLKIFFGTVPTFHDGVRDDKVSAGIALDRKNNRWIEQGRLSDEAIDDILAP